MHRQTYLLLSIAAVILGVIFFSLAITKYQIQTSTRAASQGLSITLDLVTAGASEYTWSGEINTNQNSIGPSVPGTVLVYHCGFSTGTAREGNGNPNNCNPESAQYFGEIKNETITITATVGNTFSVMHPAVECGTVQIHIADPSTDNDLTSTFGNESYDTGTTCTVSPTPTLTSPPPTDTPLTDVPLSTSPSPIPSETISPEPTVTLTPVPTDTPTPVPTDTPTPEPTETVVADTSPTVAQELTVNNQPPGFNPVFTLLIPFALVLLGLAL